MKVLPLLSWVVLALVVLVSCEKEPPNSVIANPIPPTNVVVESPHEINSPYYFQIVIGGVDTFTYQTLDSSTRYVNVAEDLCNCPVKDSVMGMEDTIGHHYSISSAVWPQRAINNPTPENIKDAGGIAFSWVGQQPIADLFTYQNIIQRDSNLNWGRTARTNLNDNGDDGVSVYWVNDQGVRWASDLGLTWQPDGYVIVEEYKENDEGGDPWRIIKTRFDCRLYNDSGAVLNATGIFRGKIVTWPQ